MPAGVTATFQRQALTPSSSFGGGTARPSPNTKRIMKDVAHPICGKCYSVGVYRDYDASGQPVIVCIICGNRYPGGKEGFYMSDKVKQTDGKKTDAASLPGDPGSIEGKSRRICVTCKEKPTISDSCPYCPSCMNKKGREVQKGKTSPTEAEEKRPMKDKAPPEKTPSRQNLTVNIDFEKHRHVLKQVQDLADQEIRPLDLQIIFLLKCHFDKEALSK
jgi:hypothetical protein